ncbi:MAG: hypothetical protein IJC34_08955 [Lentisphaeria bacterium]|nr:hypothetical protein [Lentisphaeria bacterium]
MKKFYLALIAVFCIGALWANEAPAQSQAAPANQTSENWTILQLGFLPGAPTDMLTDPVYGVKIGAPISIGAPVWGVEASVLYSGSEDVNGIQCSLVYSEAKNLNGLQFSIVNFVQNCCGIQIGVINSAKDKTIQLGLINHIENGPLPWSIIFNCNL